MADTEGMTDEELAGYVLQLWNRVQEGDGRLKAHGISADLSMRMQQRLDFIIHCLVGPQGSRNRSQFEVFWYEFLLSEQATTESNAVRAKLMRGVNGPLPPRPAGQ